MRPPHWLSDHWAKIHQYDAVEGSPQTQSDLKDEVWARDRFCVLSNQRARWPNYNEVEPAHIIPRACGANVRERILPVP